MSLLTFIKTDQNYIIDTDKSYLPFYVEKISNEKNLVKIIKKIETMIRTSKEYKLFINEIKSLPELNNDVFFPNMTKDQDIEIELHHFPLTLFDIIEILIINHLINKNPFSTFLIANEVLEEHINFNIGVVPLNKTNHQLVHSDKLELNLNYCFGNYQNFINKYENAISVRIRKKYNEILEKSNKTTNLKFLEIKK